MSLTRVAGIRVGHAEVAGGRSGCTVVLGPFRGAVEVRGLATGSRELDLLSPRHTVERVHGVLLTGGSAHGLAAADGVMAWLEERGEGYETPGGLVPLVPGAVVYDLAPGTPRPGRGEGRRACEAASEGPVAEGRVGAGAGATVGKARGIEWAVPGGVGSAAVTLKWNRTSEEGASGPSSASASSRDEDGPAGPVEEVTVGALAVVNALGDVVDRDGSVLAGSRAPGGTLVESDGEGGEGGFADPLTGTNTTLVVVATDAPLSRTDLGRMAGMAAGAFSRAIVPANTPFDGDILFALSTARKEHSLPPARLLALGEVGRRTAEDAIRRAVSEDRRRDRVPAGEEAW